GGDPVEAEFVGAAELVHRRLHRADRDLARIGAVGERPDIVRRRPHIAGRAEERGFHAADPIASRMQYPLGRRAPIAPCIGVTNETRWVTVSRRRYACARSSSIAGTSCPIPTCPMISTRNMNPAG